MIGCVGLRYPIAGHAPENNDGIGVSDVAETGMDVQLRVRARVSVAEGHEKEKFKGRTMGRHRPLCMAALASRSD